MGKKVTVDDVAQLLAGGFRGLPGQYPIIFEDSAERYAGIEIAYDIRNPTPEDELRQKPISAVRGGFEFLFLSAGNKLDRFGQIDVCVYVRDHNCLYDGGHYNASVLVSEVRDSTRMFFACSKPQEGGIFKPCGEFGRVGFALRL